MAVAWERDYMKYMYFVMPQETVTPPILPSLQHSKGDVLGKNFCETLVVPCVVNIEAPTHILSDIISPLASFPHLKAFPSSSC